MPTSPRPASWPFLPACASLIYGVTLGTLPSPLEAQDPAVLRGRVAEERTAQPIRSARVILIGTGAETETLADGSFAFEDAPLGRHFVRVQARGYPAVVEEVELTPGTDLFLPVLLASAAAVLDELLVLGRRGAPPKGAAMTAADLLSREVPQVSAFTTVAGRRFPTSVDIRGRGSFSSGEPVVVLDGVRFSGGVGEAMDRLRQIAAGDVKSIRVLEGATAGFLYGAPNGVIYVQTHEAAEIQDR